jgi:hypothetical protein
MEGDGKRSHQDAAKDVGAAIARTINARTGALENGDL